MSNPVVSTIIAAYNDDAYIAEAIMSVLMQSIDNIEIICVDDGSTDNTPDIIQDFARSDSRVKYCRQQNQGAGPARNHGITASNGNYLAFLDADDYIPHEKTYETLVAVAEKQGTLVSCGYLVKDIDGAISCDDELRYFKTEQILQYNDYQYDYEFYKYLYSSELVKGNNFSFPSYRRFQDPPFLVRCLYEAKTFSYAPIPAYAYRRQNKTINWTPEKVTAYARGVLDILEFSAQHRLIKLHDTALYRIEHNWYGPLIDCLLNSENAELMDVLKRINQAINTEMIDIMRPGFLGNYTIRPLRDYARLKHTS